jgi:hypothetical protein
MSAQQHNIDTQKSTLTIHVGKTGAFSGLGHEHEVHAPIHSGTADTGQHPAVEIHVDARALRVVDKGESEKDRTEVQAMDATRTSDAARTDASGDRARDTKGWALHWGEHREADRLRDQASRKSGRPSERRS